MAIKIPSKNIYEMENPKIRDNVIDNVSVEQTVVAPDNEYDVSVYQTTSNNKNVGTLNSRGRIKYSYEMVNTGLGQYRHVLCASYVQLQTTYTENINIIIQKLLKNKYISKILDGKNAKNENNIKVSVYQQVKKQDVYLNYTYSSSIQNTGEQEFYPSNQIMVDKSITSNGINNIPIENIDYDNNLVKVVQETSEEVTGLSVSIKNELTEVLRENISTNKFYTLDDEDSYKLDNLTVLSGIVITKMDYKYASGGVTGSAPPSTIKLVGTREYYTPERVEVSIYGNTVGISLTDGSITYIKDDSGNVVEGVGNKPHSLSGNELLQDSATTNSILTTNELAKNVLTQYEKGKETATLLCDINEYYDYSSGELKISVKNNSLPMTFKIGDEVIPMVSNYTYGNKDDKPMSKNKDDTPKVFIICGIEKIYDGAVWQKLYMQEK